MKTACITTLAMLVWLSLVPVGLGQDDGGDQQVENRRRRQQRQDDQRQDEQRQDEQRRPQRGLIGQLSSSLEQLELADDVRGKIGQLMEEYAPRLRELQQQRDGILSEEQRQARAAATRQARQDGLQGRAAREAIDQATSMSDEQRAEFAEIQRSMRRDQRELLEQIAAQLTDEQNQALRELRGDRGGDRNAGGDRGK